MTIDDHNFFDTLKSMDAAPRQELSPEEADRREVLLFEILTAADPAADRTRRRKTFKWASISVGALLVGAAAVGAIVAAPSALEHVRGEVAGESGAALSSTQLASWTSTPRQLNASSSLAVDAKAWCVSNVPNAGAGSSLTNLDARGLVASVLIRNGDSVYYCLNGGNNHSGMFEKDDSAPPAGTIVSADHILTDSGGSIGDGSQSLSYLVGFAGAGVTGVTLHVDGVGDVVATVESGYWTAWWPESANSPLTGPTGTASITTSTGATRSVTMGSIAPDAN